MRTVDCDVFKIFFERIEILVSRVFMKKLNFGSVITKTINLFVIQSNGTDDLLGSEQLSFLLSKTVVCAEIFKFFDPGSKEWIFLL